MTIVLNEVCVGSEGRENYLKGNLNAEVPHGAFSVYVKK
jgi:hypothetical protein